MSTATLGPPQRRLRVTLPPLHPGQQELSGIDARFRVTAAGRRWGKTRWASRRVIAAALEDPGGYFWVAPTFPLATVGWEEMKWLASQIPGKDIHEGERRIYLPGGGWVQAKSASNVDSLRSRGLKGAVLEECAFMPEEAWTLAIRPALADKAGWADFISTPNGHNWYYELAERAKTRDAWAYYHAPTWDNPFIPADEIEAMRHELGPVGFAQEVEALFTAEGQHSFDPQLFRYFSETSDGYVLRKKDGSQELVSHDDVWVVQACDLAFSESQTADWFVIVTMGITRTGQRLILDVFRTRVAPSNQPAVIEERYRNHPGARKLPTLVGVEDAFQQISVVQELQRRSGIPIRGMKAQKARGATSKDISAKVVRALRPAQLYQNEKVFHRENAEWLADLERELWDFPLGRHDDQCVAAGTMIETPEGAKPIERVRAGDLVACSLGWRRVLAVARTSKMALLWRLELSDGTVLMGTANHPVRTPAGWRPMDALTYADVCVLRSSSSRECDSVATPTRSRTLTAATSRPASPIDSAAFRRSIRRSGRRLMGRSLTGTRFTTATATPATTISGTSTASLSRSTGDVTGMRTGQSGSSNISRPSGRGRLRGTPPTKGSLGIASMVCASGRSARISSSSASNAGTRTPRSSRGLATAQAVALRLLGELPGSTTRRGCASAAADRSRSTATRRSGSAGARVVRVGPTAEFGPVYNLTVAEAHDYYANGVLVHNCDALSYAVELSEMPGAGLMEFYRRQAEQTGATTERPAQARVPYGTKPTRE